MDIALGIIGTLTFILALVMLLVNTLRRRVKERRSRSNINFPLPLTGEGDTGDRVTRS